MHALLRAHPGRIAVERLDLKELRRFFYAKRDFMLRLLGIPSSGARNLYGHAAGHLPSGRGGGVSPQGLVELPASDYKHLDSDLNRAFDLLLVHQSVRLHELPAT